MAVVGIDPDSDGLARAREAGLEAPHTGPDWILENADDIELTIPAESGLVLVTPGLMLKGNATALVIRAYASAASVVNIHGYVNEIA